MNGFPPSFMPPQQPGVGVPAYSGAVAPQAQQAPYSPAPPAPPPPPLEMLRVCFSKSLTCSGCNPCDTCLAIVRERILPAAMMGGGFNGDASQAQSFFAAYAQAWSQLKLNLQQSIALNQLPALDVRFIQEGMQLLQAQMQAEQMRAAAAASPVENATAPIAPIPPTVVLSALGGAQPSETFEPMSAVTTTDGQPALVNGLTPLTVEDVLAIASPVAQLSQGPQALGSIFNVTTEEVTSQVRAGAESNGASGHGRG